MLLDSFSIEVYFQGLLTPSDRTFLSEWLCWPTSWSFGCDSNNLTWGTP